MFPMFPYPQVIPTMASPHSISKHLDSVGLENLEREDILKLAKRCGTDTIRSIRRFLAKRVRSTLSKCNASVLRVEEAAIATEVEAMEGEDVSTASEQSDEKSSVTVFDEIEEYNTPPRIIYRETEHGFVAQRIDEDPGLPSLSATITNNKNKPAYTTVLGATWPTLAVYQPEGFTQYVAEPMWDESEMLYEEEYSENTMDEDAPQQKGAILDRWELTDTSSGMEGELEADEFGVLL
ncbi:hypothetical protein BDY19DRAFT_909338 [Irpex rosettiformis]|uniref:Uncharacterized protein n=1 Tax=Irpex rosettiformis TaxID=378272 RepID=A0ACB8TSQ1_9APHY|nr:hypothetical protein BDY19DRAFT_909338 [Irpex rosettiformis]